MVHVALQTSSTSRLATTVLFFVTGAMICRDSDPSGAAPHAAREIVQESALSMNIEQKCACLCVSPSPWLSLQAGGRPWPAYPMLSYEAT